MSLPIAVTSPGAALLDFAGRVRGGGYDQQAGATFGLGDVLLVDADGYPLVRGDGVAQPASGSSGVMVAGLDDANARVNAVDSLGQLRQAVDTILFAEEFGGSAVSSELWTSNVTTMTAVFATGSLTLNGSAITTTGTGAMYVTNKKFRKFTGEALKFRARLRSTLVANQEGDTGFTDNVTALTAQISNGAVWRWTTGGTIVPAFAFNGTDIFVGSNIAGSLNAANYYNFEVTLEDDSIQFICRDSNTGLIVNEQVAHVPLTQLKTFFSDHIGAGVRVRNNSAPASAGQFIVTQFNVRASRLDRRLPFGATQSAMGFNAAWNPLTGVLTPNYANSAAPASATLSNTAAGYTTLGGQWQFAAVAGAETDYALFGYTVPAGLTLHVTGIDISAFNMGAAVATTPHLLQWEIMTNAAAISLATAAQRDALGVMGFPVGAAVGTPANQSISHDFSQAPKVSYSGRFFVLGLKMPVATATGSQIIRGTATVKGYFE